MGIVAGVIGLASAYDQSKAARRAERKQKEANRIQKAAAAAQKGIERRKAISGARQIQASNIAGAVGQGISIGSSPLQGAQAAIGSGLGSSFSQQGRESTSSQQTFDLRQSAAFTEANARANAAFAQAVAGTSKAIGDAIPKPVPTG